MKIFLYPRLAWSGIRKNKELYIPYLLTCIGMIMMYYIVSYLYTGTMLETVYGGDVLAVMMGLGRFVIGAFSVIFLFYTHSFLIRRRKKEFGLYSILGMNRGNLARILIWESLMSAGISMVTGIACGILFSKLAELLMNSILRGEADYVLRINSQDIQQTLILYLVIFFLILLVTLRQIKTADPIKLLQSETVGEQLPRANWIMALAGLILLGTAYYMAVTLEDPISAIQLFFVAVILVIIGTYLLFIAGSVALCRLLQKNKRYYYRTNHFVSVSSMTYRMKRNGAGLASICILCTMVLVMLVSTVCLYGGVEGTLRSRYPRNIITENCAESWQLLQEENFAMARNAMEQVAAAHKLTPENVLDYSAVCFIGYLREGVLKTDTDTTPLFTEGYNDIWQVFVIPLADYNRIMETQEVLGDGELLMYTRGAGFKRDTLEIGEAGQIWQVRKTPEFVDHGAAMLSVVSSMYLFVEDVESFIRPMTGLVNSYGEPVLSYQWLYGFDLDCADEEQSTIFYEIGGALSALEAQGIPISFSEESVAVNRYSFYQLYGGLFFLGIMLGLVFVVATTLIMYYKQISEGYEDQGRFEILKKVGMTGREIRKSINSQVMTVFFLPLLVAGIHLAFAFPFLYKALLMMGFDNLRLLVMVTAVAYLLFGAGYVLVYRITSRAYYHLVGSGA